jgi:Methyltransferase domain
MIELFQRSPWQMTAGERAALDGLLCNLAPNLSIEIGTAEGGSLRCLAERSQEVHSFDVVAPPQDIAELANVTVHTGDSHALLPEVLSQLESAGRNVDFALVDGDHTAAGVRRDVEDLLSSGAVTESVILLHDTANEEVREGLEAIDYSAWPRVTAVDLDFVPGYLVRVEAFHQEIWGGLGMIVVGDGQGDGHPMQLVSEIAYSASEVLVQHRRSLLAGKPAGATPDAEELGRLRTRTADLERRLAVITGSHSWRVTAPLRRLVERLRSR